MSHFDTFISTAVPLPVSNIDTDQIIPARFLKFTDKAGFGNYLFQDWRTNDDGTPNPDFVLNKSQYSGRILIAGQNFGCGSSREHAAWALADYGFTAVISSFFADIFKNNALNNNLLPVAVSDDMLQTLLKTVEQNPATKIKVSLSEQMIGLLPDGPQVSFKINPYKKDCLLNNSNDFDYLVNKLPEIKAFEQRNESIS